MSNKRSVKKTAARRKASAEPHIKRGGGTAVRNTADKPVEDISEGGAAEAASKTVPAGSYANVILNGVVVNNPVLVQLLGMCPTLAVSTSMSNALGMGVASTFVLICSNTAVSLLRRVIPARIRIASYIVIIAGFVTMIDLLLKAYLPAISRSLGLFIPLIAVNCIVLARAETYASRNGVLKSAADGLGMGLGFMGALLIIATLREIIGGGTWFGIPVLGSAYQPAIIIALPAGGFLVLGFVIAAVQWLTARFGHGNTK